MQFLAEGLHQVEEVFRKCLLVIKEIIERFENENNPEIANDLGQEG
ncbi:MAG: hypothetical protein ABJB16_10890 [Saprospiraceae bacterium]